MTEKNQPKIEDVSIIIPAYGKCRYLSDIIKAIQNQTVQPKEIIIGHSSNNNPKMDLEKIDKRVRVIHTQERMYAGKARNLAVTYATGEYLAFLDADVIPQPAWLESLLCAVHKKGDDNYYAGSIGYAQPGGYWGLSLWIIEFGSQHSYLPMREVESMAGCNGLIKRKHFQFVGGFPDHIRVAEDAYIQQKLRDRGIKIIFVPKALGNHVNIAGFRHFVQHLSSLGKNAATVRKKFLFSGSFFTRYPIFIPGLFLARNFQIAIRIFRYGKNYRRKFILALPGILMGLAIWASFFFIGALKNNES